MKRSTLRADATAALLILKGGNAISEDRAKGLAEGALSLLGENDGLRDELDSAKELVAAYHKDHEERLAEIRRLQGELGIISGAVTERFGDVSQEDGEPWLNVFEAQGEAWLKTVIEALHRAFRVEP